MDNNIPLYTWLLRGLKNVKGTQTFWRTADVMDGYSVEICQICKNVIK